jgi:hypothetical protein
MGIDAGCYNAEHASYMGLEDKWNHACLIISKVLFVTEVVYAFLLFCIHYAFTLDQTHPYKSTASRAELSTFSKGGPKGLTYIPTYTDDIEKFFLEHIGWDFFPKAKDEL